MPPLLPPDSTGGREGDVNAKRDNTGIVDGFRAARALALGVALALLFGCGRGIDPGLAERGVFEPYFQRFLDYARERDVAVPGAEILRIELAELRSSEVGRCETGFLQGRIVYIDRVRWESMSDASREALILHELGHCLLDRGHRTERFAEDAPTMGGLPKSLMFPYAAAGSRYLEYQTYYLDELFAAGQRRSGQASPEPPHDHSESCQGH